MKQFYITLVLLATFFFNIPASYACRFIPDTQPLKVRLEDYDTAFIGKVLEAKGKEGTGDTDAVFLVVAPVKGTPKHDDKIKVTSHRGSCSFRFNADEIWLITADGEEQPYATSMPDASALIQESRGLPVQGWRIVKPLLSDKDFAELLGNNKCISATQEMTDFLDKLDRNCSSDQDCSGFFINPFPCQEAVIANKHALQPAVSKALEDIQAAVRAACPIKVEQIPACEAPAIHAVCAQGQCKERSAPPAP